MGSLLTLSLNLLKGRAISSVVSAVQTDGTASFAEKWKFHFFGEAGLSIDTTATTTNIEGDQQ